MVLLTRAFRRFSKAALLKLALRRGLLSLSNVCRTRGGMTRQKAGRMAAVTKVIIRRGVQY